MVPLAATPQPWAVIDPVPRAELPEEDDLHSQLIDLRKKRANIVMCF